MAVLGAGCGDSGSDSSLTQVVVDGDGAFDDVKAILYLLEQPDIKVLAITMSGTGIAHCPAAAENVSAVLERIGAPDIPVACGRTTPLAGNNEAPEIWRTATDNLSSVDLPDPRPLAGVAAPALLAETISASDDVVLVALGPLTNVAEAFEADPELVERVEMIYLMGGAVDVQGNVLYANPAAEFNIWADPHAAAIVFSTDVPITLVPLDATNAVPVTPYLYEAVAAHRDFSAVSQFTADYLDATPLIGGLYHWDELAAVIATDESVATIEDRKLAVVEEGGAEAGATIETADGRAVRVALDADRQAFEDHFYEAIIGTGDTGLPDWEPDASLTWDGSTCTYQGPDSFSERLIVQINNLGADAMAMITGTYAPATTTADLETFRAANNAGTPDWWTQRALFAVPTGAHDVWVVEGGPEITALCFLDNTRVWEIAGPRLPD
jgi:inosine-uridine nucleoside N-ribohydrolase